jgi:hypothetical protein
MEASTVLVKTPLNLALRLMSWKLINMLGKLLYINVTRMLMLRVTTMHAMAGVSIRKSGKWTRKLTVLVIPSPSTL